MMKHPQYIHPTPHLAAAAPSLLEACELAIFYLAPYATGDSELRAARLLRDAVEQAHGNLPLPAPVNIEPPIVMATP